METKETTYAQKAIRERIPEKIDLDSLIKQYKHIIIIIVVLLFPIVALAEDHSYTDHCNASYTKSQIDSLVCIEVQRQVDTQLLDLKIDKAANIILEKYRDGQTQFQEKHDYFLGALITLLVAVVGIVIPLILNQDREKKIKKMERKLSKIMSYAEESEFSITLTRALANEDAGVRIFALSQIIRTHKDNSYVSHAYNNRGYEYDDRGDYEKAIADYTKAIQLKPDYAEAYNNRGISYSNRKQYDKAMDDYSKAIKLNPDYSIAYCNRAGIFIDYGMYKEALKDLRKAIKLNPYSDKAFGEFAQVQLLQGNNKEALIKINSAIHLNEDEYQWYFLRSFILVNLKQYENALHDARISLRMAKRSSTKEVIIEIEKHLEFVESLHDNANGKELPNNTNTDGIGRNADNKESTLTVYDEDAFNEDDLKRLLKLLKKYYRDSDRGFPNGNTNKKEESNEDNDE